ncbi:MAG TPA: ORF6N domain-containing protein [Candidatus Onthousia excrementipullorum]|uniref:ORF6N domain-containing protein n=1 Tax=Candidatus Onthousia excrementipullorum TaxID=2840884 RepID=A0A9D1DVQ0_9FIRM|nr:ORF6N domain-containing protein [Candidatus Onthousia excrementipullorum]
MVINDLIVKENKKIEDMIYEIRGKQVMLDSDLAKLYECANGTKTINLAVKRHINRFPERFMFQLTKDEYYEILRFQFETLELEQGKYSKYLPYVFTEQGVAMLATVLRTPVAEEVSIRIMDAFVAMRKYISTNLIEQKYINDLVLKDSKRIDLLEDAFSSFKEQNNHIFFEGQIYDAYSLMIKIFDKAKESIIIIDNYIDKNILDILSKTNKQVTLITNKYKIQDYEKYKEQYNNVTLVVNNSFHDRFIILDKKDLYHSGASFKDLGNKCFAITKIESKEILDSLLDKLE